MRWLLDRLARLRWLAVPIAAYLTITLALPLANGAAGRAGFARHASWVLAGCVAVLAAAFVGDLACSAIRRIAHRRTSPAGGRS